MMGDAIVDQKGHLCEMALRKVDCLDFQESRRRNVVAWVLGLLDPPSDPPPSSPKDWGRGTEERPVSLLGREDLKKGGIGMTAPTQRHRWGWIGVNCYFCVPTKE